MTNFDREKEKKLDSSNIDSGFFTWFKTFADSMRKTHGICVTMRDGNAIMYRNLYDRGYSPERATSMFHQQDN